MKTSVKLFLLFIVLYLSRSASNAQPQDSEVVNQLISSQESYEKGYLAKGTRTVVKGDLNHDGIIDVAVLYTLEGQNGTNNYVQYLAVFLRVDGQLVFVVNTPVGGKHYRSIALTSIKDNIIWCKTLGYAEKDPTCCPTITGSTQFELRGNKLKELPRQ